VKSEDELAQLCGDCHVGAFPPIGQLYGMEVWIDWSLGRPEHIVFNAGTHTDAVRMRYADYVNLVKPRVARFAARAEGTAA
jgi:Ala-tRNA(Pro) deacylase